MYKKNCALKKGVCGQQTEDIILNGDECIFLKVSFDFENNKDSAIFNYSTNGIKWTKIGTELPMIYTLDLFIGYRIGIFYYAEEEAGGFADFRNFTYET